MTGLHSTPRFSVVQRVQHSDWTVMILIGGSIWIGGALLLIGLLLLFA
jgi:hypothetical protein